MNENRLKKFVKVEECVVEKPRRKMVKFTTLDGRVFEITIWDSGAIGVWRTVYGKPAPRQVLPKTFWSLEDAIQSYAGLNKMSKVVRAAFSESVSV